MNYAIILAGGTGSRMGIDRPKQLLLLHGHTVLEHSIEAFARHPRIGGIVVVVHPSTRAEVEDIILRHRATDEAWQKVQRVVDGGGTRAESSWNALKAVEEMQAEGRAPGGKDDVNVLFHDAARPLVSPRIISDVCQALQEASVVNVGIAVTDTIMECHEGIQRRTLDRSALMRVQTPQGFRMDTIVQAYRLAMADPAFQATDDCGIVMNYLPHTMIRVVEGEETNLKLTYAEDIPLFEFLMQRRRHGPGQDETIPFS